MDQFDIVRAYYRALNARDVDAVVGLYDPACITEDVFLSAGAAKHTLPDEIHSGRETNRARCLAFSSNTKAASTTGVASGSAQSEGFKPVGDGSRPFGSSAYGPGLTGPFDSSGVRATFSLKMA